MSLGYTYVTNDTAPPPPKSTNEKIIFYDFESRQNEMEQWPEEYLKPEPECKSHTESQSSCRKYSLFVHCRNSWSGKFKLVANFGIGQTECSLCIKSEISKASICVSTKCQRCKAKDKNGNFLNDPCHYICGY